MDEFWLGIQSFFGRAWWVEVRTTAPPCTYYFGPFADRAAAAAAQEGYREDLELEGARGIETVAKRCKPHALTLVGDELEREQLDRLGAFLQDRELYGKEH